MDHQRSAVKINKEPHHELVSERIVGYWTDFTHRENSITDSTSIRIRNLKENVAILSVHCDQLGEVAQPRRDGAIELIRLEGPERGR